MQCSLMMLSFRKLKIMLLKWEYQISRGLANGCSADAECRAAMQAAESDEEDADDGESASWNASKIHNTGLFKKILDGFNPI